MQQLKLWYAGLEQTEQRIVLAGTTILALMIIYFGILLPIDNSVSKLQRQVDSRQKSVNNWKQALPVIMANRGQGISGSSNQPLSNIITSTSNQHNLNMSRVQEKNADEMQVWFDNVPFNNFIRWVSEIQQTYGVKVASVNIRSKDRNGLSSIDIKIRKG